MPTLLHISDLHRASEPHLNNDDLVAAILSDATRWKSEAIPWPDLVVVSGDLIRGASIDAPDPDSEIAAQYAEASEFLSQLAEAFVDSDRSRVVIVPGNHDVQWSRARNAMKPLSTSPDGIARKAFQAGSSIRWNWKDQQAYEIIDRHLYDSRFDHFRQFQANFYSGLNPSPFSHDHSDLVFFEYPALGLVVAGFSSCYGNDCFCHVGEIDSGSLALSRQLLATSMAPVAIAVWHHGVVGGPHAQDYMDQRVTHRLIDFGFSVGLHGHQHYSAAAPFQLRLPNLTSMAVVGAGSLAAGDAELPMGERRQFNVVTIDPNSESATVHVRAMSSEGVFTGSHREDFGGNTFIKLTLPPSPARPKEPTPTQWLDEAMNALAVHQYERVLALLPKISPLYFHEKRHLEAQALHGLERLDELIRLLDPPQNANEVTWAVALLIDARRFDEAVRRLQAASSLVDQATFKALTATIAARRHIS